MARAFTPRPRGGIYGSPEQAALGDIGAALFGIGFEWTEEEIVKENNRQISNARIAMLKEWDGLQRHMADNADKPDKWGSFLKDNTEKIRKEVFASITQPGALEAMQLEFNETIAQWKSDVGRRARAQFGTNAATDYDVGIKSLQEARTFPDVQGLADHIQEGRDYIDSGPLMTDAERLEGKRAFTQLHIENYLLQSGDPALIDDPNRFATALEMELPNVAGEQQVLFGPDEIVKLKNAYRLQRARAQAEAKDAAAVEAETWRAESLIKLRNRELTYADVDDAPIPTTGDLGRQEFYKLLEAQEKDALKGEDIVSNQQVEAQLEEMALDIWTGAVTKTQFDSALLKARYTDRSIDDSAFDSLATVAAKEHKAYQAGALKDAVSHAQTQLVTVQESLIESLFAIVEDDEDKQTAEDMKNRRKLELANLDRYRKSLNDWFKANPEADADAIYKQSRKMLSQYRKMSLKDISQARESFEAWLSPENFLVSLPAQIGKFQQAEKAPRPGSTVRVTDGTEIGTYNTDGTITLNANGLRMLKRATGGDKELARRIIKEKGFVILEE